jgi:Ca2+-binding EF-hand superfamily protein
MRRLIAPTLAAACLVLVLGGSLTLGTPRVCAAGGAGASAGDVQDLFFLGGGETVLVRIHIRIDDRPLNTAWRAAVAALHRYLHFNGAGTVARDEELPDLVPILRAPLEVRPGLPARAVQDAAFARIDASGDGTLDAGERDQAGKVLLRFDRNDDESIGMTELQPPEDRSASSMAPEERAKTDSVMFLVDRSESRIRTVQLVLNRFDTGGPGGARAKDHRLARSEIRLPAGVFRQFDGNHDGALDSAELLDFLDESDPTVEVIIRLGSRPEGRPALEFLDRRAAGPAASAAPGVKLRRAEANVLTIDLGDAWVDLRTEDVPWDAARARQTFDQTFQDIDFDDSKTITVSEARGRAPFDRLFRLMDRNGDGQITVPEMNDVLGLVEDLWRGHAQIVVMDRGVQVFGNLDTSGDGRLGLRELHAASAQLAAFDRNGDGKVAAREIPHRFEWVFSQAPLQLGVFAGTPGPAGSSSGRSSTAGPRWFGAMDRNGDGDLSAREFVGPPAVFLRLDADRDGLIDAREAAAMTPQERSP